MTEREFQAEQHNNKSSSLRFKSLSLPLGLLLSTSLAWERALDEEQDQINMSAERKQACPLLTCSPQLVFAAFIALRSCSKQGSGPGVSGVLPRRDLQRDSALLARVNSTMMKTQPKGSAMVLSLLSITECLPHTGFETKPQTGEKKEDLDQRIQGGPPGLRPLIHET